MHNNKDQLNYLVLNGLKNKIYATANCELHAHEVHIGYFNNCREYGHTYTIKTEGSYPITFCVYEHRNSDLIIINGCFDKEIKAYGPYLSDIDKYAYLYSSNSITDIINKLYTYLVEIKYKVFDFSILGSGSELFKKAVHIAITNYFSSEILDINRTYNIYLDLKEGKQITTATFWEPFESMPQELILENIEYLIQDIVNTFLEI